MRKHVKNFESFIKENLYEDLNNDNEEFERNDAETEDFLNNYMAAMEKLDSKELE